MLEYNCKEMENKDIKVSCTCELYIQVGVGNGKTKNQFEPGADHPGRNN
ncbi:MAG: hypothetical protein IJ301_01870 [Clostridia bacterium]|nr:hypothetical protein [Clostridia bacterium]